MATLAAVKPVQNDWTQWLLFSGPALLLGGALAFQHLAGLAPCELCMWQRWPHLAAMVLTLAVFPLPRARTALLALAALAVLVSAGVGVLHVGVEHHWWVGPTTCSSYARTGGDFMTNMMQAPLVRCDAAAWSLFGVSMAGWNAICSTLIGLGGLRLLGLGK